MTVSEGQNRRKYFQSSLSDFTYEARDTPMKKKTSTSQNASPERFPRTLPQGLGSPTSKEPLLLKTSKDSRTNLFGNLLSLHKRKQLHFVIVFSSEHKRKQLHSTLRLPPICGLKIRSVSVVSSLRVQFLSSLSLSLPRVPPETLLDPWETLVLLIVLFKQRVGR